MPERKIETGTLYLIPSPLIPYSVESWAPQRIRNLVSPAIIASLQRITHFVVESEKSATRFLSRIVSAEHFANIIFFPLDEHSSEDDLEAPLATLRRGQDCAIISEAGLPCIADPGAALVAAAHRARIRVVPLGADSSLLMALAASGLNGQTFSFIGYLPVSAEALRNKLSAEGSGAARDKAARIFIETPYRNAKTLQTCLAVLPDSLQLCFAGGLGTDAPNIISMPVAQWKANVPAVPEIPAVFCFGVPARLGRAASARHPNLARRR